jgi:ferredoxin-NADP reductase
MNESRLIDFEETGRLLGRGQFATLGLAIDSEVVERSYSIQLPVGVLYQSL